MKDLLSKEDIDFIKNLSREITTQDTRGTASPYGLIIGKKETQIADYDNCDNKAINWGESEYDSFEEFIEAIEEYYLEDCEQSDIVDFIKENCTDIDDLKNYEYEIAYQTKDSFHVYGYNIVDTFNPNLHCVGNFFLTDKSAKEYIENNKHNLGKSAFTYGIHLYRNPEMKKLIEIIVKLGEKLCKEN